MYHIGVKTFLFVRRIPVTQHEYGQVLNYATSDGKVVTIPASAIKKFVVYPDYWQHVQKLEAREEHRQPSVEEVQAKELADLRQGMAQMYKELAILKATPPPPQFTRVPQVSPRVTEEEAMESEVMRRARERMNGFQPT